MMPLCVVCGANNQDVFCCPHHIGGRRGDDWSTTNRIYCDLLHRQITPVRIVDDELTDVVQEVNDGPTPTTEWTVPVAGWTVPPSPEEVDQHARQIEADRVWRVQADRTWKVPPRAD